MAIRRLTDKQGTRWEVYEVPSPAHQMMPPKNFSVFKSPNATDRSLSMQSPVSERLSSGWLCFESPSEKRRIGPAPANWDQMSSSELESLLIRAAPVPNLKQPGHRETDADS